MITDCYDDKTNSVIQLGDVYGPAPEKPLIDKCMIIYSDEISKYLLENYKCEQIGFIGACNGNFPVYKFSSNGEEIGFYLSPIGSAVASSSCYEVSWQTGAKKFVMFGSCGSLDGEKTKGKFVVPTESYRGDGASYYYAPPADYITIKNAQKLASIFDKLKIPYVLGKNWSCDAILRETKALCAARRSEGCISVDMELSGMQAICDYHGIELYDFLEAGDVLSETSYEIEGLHGANHNLGKLFIAIELMKHI